jgi:hypothetical protein
MSTKRRGLGKGVDALFSAEEKVPSEEPEEVDLASSKVEDISSKLDVISPDEGDGSLLKGKSSKSEVRRSDVEVKTSQVEDGVSRLDVKRSKLENKSSGAGVGRPEVEGGSSVLEGVSYNPDAMRIAIREADKNPRITLWSPVSTAVLKYLRKTIPEFSISEEASTLLEEAITMKYPELYEGLKKEKEGS